MQITRVETYNNRMQQNKRPAFGRVWEEHISWGANYIKDKGTTNFKVFAWPDAKSVFVEITKNASIKLSNIWERLVNKKDIALLTSGAVAVTSVTPTDSDSKIIPMMNKGDGVFEVKGVKASPGDGYRFVVMDKNGNISTAKDPYAKRQENILGWSTIYNSDNYEWKNTDWLEGKDSRRIVRKPNEQYRGLENLVIDEVNIPTLSLGGTFEEAKSRIDNIASRNNATAIEIMPVENTFSMQWGYDGVDKFAVNEKLGGAEKLKELVDYAHGKGLNVIIDMVPNHVGTDGNFLSKIGPYIKCSGEFGDKLNYEGKDNRYVRDWMVNAALWWANEFKVDGIRFDLTKDTESDWLLKQIVQELNEHNPKVFLIAEDHRNDRDKITRIYENNAIRHEDKINHIDEEVSKIANGWGGSGPSDIGFDSEWDSAYREAISGMVMTPDTYLLDMLDRQLQSSNHRVHYAYSHDEIGNWDGTRFIPKYLVNALSLYDKVQGNNSAEKGQKAAHAAQAIAEFVVSKDFESPNTYQRIAEIKDKYGLNDTFVSKDMLENAFKTALAKQRLMLGTIYTTPGPKMFFQGDDEADLSYFKFFRELSGEKQVREDNSAFAENKIKEKGYDTLEELARPDSIVGRVKPEGKYSNVQQQMRNFVADLKTVIENNPALIKGKITSTYKDNNHLVHMHRLQYGDNDIFVMKNYGGGFHYKSYSTLGFPQNSSWVEVFSSDSEKYGGMGFSNKGRGDITNLSQGLSLAPNSFIILKRVK